jgi:hypothetical protein
MRKLKQKRLPFVPITTKWAKQFENIFGRFEYISVSADLFFDWHSPTNS